MPGSNKNGQEITMLQKQQKSHIFCETSNDYTLSSSPVTNHKSRNWINWIK